MALKSVYLPDLVSLEHNGLIRITGDEHRHLSVSRVMSGERIEAFDGEGTVWTAKVTSVEKRQLVAEIVDKRTAPRDARQLVLALALIRTSAFELALEKVVEIGVTRIVPFSAARSNANAPRHDRCMRIMIEAVKQSKRFHVPALDEPVGFDRILSFDARTKIAFAEREGGAMPHPIEDSPVLYVVGPEGGWTDDELQRMKTTGFTLVSLGEAILKADTAAIVGAALIHYAPLLS